MWLFWLYYVDKLFVPNTRRLYDWMWNFTGKYLLILFKLGLSKTE